MKLKNHLTRKQHLLDDQEAISYSDGLISNDGDSKDKYLFDDDFKQSVPKGPDDVISEPLRSCCSQKLLAALCAGAMFWIGFGIWAIPPSDAVLMSEMASTPEPESDILEGALAMKVV